MITKLYSTPYCVTMIQYIHFGQNPSFSSRERQQDPHQNQYVPPFVKGDIYTTVWSESMNLLKRKHVGTLFWAKFDISKCCCDLENKVKVTKILLTLSDLQTMYLYKFGQNPLTGLEVRMRERLIFAVFIG